VILCLIMSESLPNPLCQDDDLTGNSKSVSQLPKNSPPELLPAIDLDPDCVVVPLDLSNLKISSSGKYYKRGCLNKKPTIVHPSLTPSSRSYSDLLEGDPSQVNDQTKALGSAIYPLKSPTNLPCDKIEEV
jgi:hypothetical protein